jgi:hypothetical protein
MGVRITAARWLAAFLVVACAPPAALSQEAADSLTREQMAQFLSNARIVAHKDIPVGVTRPVRLTLDDGQLRHDAAFSSFEETTPIMRFKDGRTELDFVDSYRFSIAAYRVAELLDLDHMMPVTVERTWQRRKGALSWWLDVQMDERERVAKGLRPPDPDAWSDQVHRMRVFAQLVGDTDRNVGNVLIGHDWRLYMIDFTRGFRRTRQLLNVNDLQRCDRELLARLRALTRDTLIGKTKPYIGGAEVDALLARRDLIIARFEQLVAERGEAQVLY